MTFRIFSDLHLEFDKNDKILEKCKQITLDNPCDYLILAGDIVDYRHRRKLNDFVNNVGFHYKNIIYVLGNHEYYGNPYYRKHKGAGQLIMQKVISDYRKICEDLGIILLENEHCYVEEEDLYLYGTTLWSKISLKSCVCLNDKNSVGVYEIVKVHKDAKEKLSKFLENTEKRTIVITHHLPSFQLVDSQYYEEDPENGINAGFASNCEELFKKPITDWIFGHTHIPMQKKISNINFWCNPHGYPDENEDYNDLHIQIV